MLIALGVAAALSASWAPAAKFSLVCQGTQTGYQESTPTRLSLPWAETITVDLSQGTWCSYACAKPDPIAAVSASGIDLANASANGNSNIKRFQVVGGSYQSAEASGVDGNRFHLEKTGTCTIKP